MTKQTNKIFLFLPIVHSFGRGRMKEEVHWFTWWFRGGLLVQRFTWKRFTASRTLSALGMDTSRYVNLLKLGRLCLGEII